MTNKELQEKLKTFPDDLWVKVLDNNEGYMLDYVWVEDDIEECGGKEYICLTADTSKRDIK